MRILKKEKSTEMSGAETVVRYMDYRSQAEERRKELASLRKKCLANNQASRLFNAEAPKEMAVFLQRQRELFEQERRRRKEASDLIHGFSEEDEIPPSMSREEENELEKRRKKDAFTFMSRYRAAKESIMRSTEGFWKDARDEDEETSESPSPLECAKRWDSSNRELDDLITEMEITLSSSSDDGDETELPILKGGRGTWTVIWLSLMTMCSTNVVGLVLSLALLNYNLRPGTAGYEDLISILGDGNFFSMCRELLEAVQESSSVEIMNISMDEDDEVLGGAMVPTSKPRYRSVQEEIYERLRDNLDQWMFDSATTFRQALTSIRNGGIGDSRLRTPALVSPMQGLGYAGGDNDEDTFSDTESHDFGSMDIIDVPALLLRAQDSIHQLLLETATEDNSYDDEDVIDLDFEFPQIESYDTSASLDFTRADAFDIARLVAKAKHEQEEESIGSVELEGDSVVDVPSPTPESPTAESFEVILEAPVAYDINARVSMQMNIPSTAPSMYTGKPKEPRFPNDKSGDREEKENRTCFPLDREDQILRMTSSESSSVTLAADSLKEGIEFLGDVYDLHSEVTTSRKDGAVSDNIVSPDVHPMDKGTESIAPSIATEAEDRVTLLDESKDSSPPPFIGVVEDVAPAMAQIEHQSEIPTDDAAHEESKGSANLLLQTEGAELPVCAAIEDEDDDVVMYNTIVNIKSEEAKGTASMDIGDAGDSRATVTAENDGNRIMFPDESGYEDQKYEQHASESETEDNTILVPGESGHEDQTLQHEASPKPIELPAEKKSRRWEAVLTLGAMTAIGFGATIALRARSKR